jgi:hypothetical protein
MKKELEDKVLDRIIDECYWDYNITKADLKNILNSHDSREMKKLFEKIIYNSKDKLLSLSLFSKQQLRAFFKDFRVTYNEKYISKHLLVLKNLLLDENNHIKSLEWKKI